MFNGRQITTIAKGADKYTDQALEIAEMVLAEYGDLVWMAEAHRFDGLLLHFRSNEHGKGWHFVTPTCGYDGTGPMTTAKILEMFGFGSAESLITEINHGDNAAYFTFSK